MRNSAFFWAVVLCLSGSLACGSTPGAQSGQDGPGADSAPDAGPGDAPDGSPSDAAASADQASRDTTGPMICRPDGGWDVPPLPANPCTLDDTDRDGVRDCIDGCPYDGLKIAPGVCGCNQTEVDSDGDGIADCIDDCRQDPGNTGYTDCGCLGMAGVSAAGSPCGSAACPQEGATCSGAGVCGDRQICNPCPGGHYVFAERNQTTYWFCGGPLPPTTSPSCVVQSGGAGAAATRMAAQSLCAAKGLALVRIQTPDENRFLARLLTSPAWIGANDLQAPGQWYWSSAASDSETLFWTGGPDGTRPTNLFTAWAAGAPAAASCASISPKGQWSDTDCSRPLAFICAYQR